MSMDSWWLAALAASVVAILALVLYYTYEQTQFAYYQSHPHTPLRDAAHQVLPTIPHAWHHIYLAGLVVVITGLLIASQGVAFVTKSAFAMYVTRVAFYMTARAFMIFVTEVPRPRVFYDEDFEVGVWKKLLRLGGCHDCIPSGHTGASLLTIFWAYQQGVLPTPLLLLLMGTSMSVPLLTRAHYSIDVIVALLLSTVLTQNIPLPR